MTRVDLPDPDAVTQVKTPGEPDGELLEVVLAHPDQLQPALPGLRRLEGTAMARFPGHVLAGQGRLGALQVGQGALGHDLAAVLRGPMSTR